MKMKQNYIIGKLKGSLCKKNGIILTNGVKKSEFSIGGVPCYIKGLAHFSFLISILR
jgi:hypothetical protein